MPAPSVETAASTTAASRSASGADADVRAVGVVDEDARSVEAQPLDDLRAHLRRGGRRDREHPGTAEPFDGGADVEVVGAEVVTPLAHAVGLVDDDQADARVREPLDDG